MSAPRVVIQTRVALLLIWTFVALIWPWPAQGGNCINPTTWPETVQVTTSGGVTSLTLGPAFIGGILQPQVTVSGNTVVIDGRTISGCQIGTPPPPTTQTFLIGQLAPGNYLLRFIHRGLAGSPIIVERPFVVGGAVVSAPVPALPALGVALLALVVGAAGVFMTRVRNQ